MSSRRLLVLTAAVFALCGCNTAYKHIGEEDPYLGESVRYNAAVQTINPDPVYPEGSAQPGESGVKAVAAVRRYRADEVNARHRRDSRIQTQSTTSGN